MPGSDSHERYTFAGFRLEPSRRLLIDADGAPVKLTAKAFDALVYLVEHAGDLVDRRTLIETLGPGPSSKTTTSTRPSRRCAARSAAATSSRWRGAATSSSPPSTSCRPTPALRRRQCRATGYPDPRSVARHLHACACRGCCAACDGRNRSIRPGPSLRHGRHRARRGRPNRARDHLSRRRRHSRSVARGLAGRVFWDARYGHSDIYVQQVSTGRPLELTRADEGLDSNPVWSPDGERIAFLRHFDQSRFDVVIIPPLGGPERTVASASAYWISVDGYPMLAWTPDGKALLFTTQLQASGGGTELRVHLLDLESGAVRLWPLARGPRDYDTSRRSRATDDGSRSRATTSASGCRP